MLSGDAECGIDGDEGRGSGVEGEEAKGRFGPGQERKRERWRKPQGHGLASQERSDSVWRWPGDTALQGRLETAWRQELCELKMATMRNGGARERTPLN